MHIIVSALRTMTIPHFRLSLLPCLLVFLSVFSPFHPGSSVSAKEKDRVSVQEQKNVIEELCLKLETLYPDRETGKKTSDGIRNYHEDGKYARYTSISEFVQHVNNDLEEISADGHLGIIHDPAMASELKRGEEKPEAGDMYAETIHETERWKNYGFKELKILEGNIGYLDLRMFFSLKYAGETAVASMAYFSNCNGLIVDLRRNGGGWDDMVTFLASYLLDSDDVIFNIMRSTLDESYYVSRSYTYVPGRKLADIPLYVLVSKSTGSAAEAFTNIMKHLHPDATVVGETTAGAENPVESLFLFDEYVLRIPCWQNIYSYTGHGWEGAGIRPDIEVASENALRVAHMDILSKLKEDCDDEHREMRYEWAIDGMNAVYHPVTVPAGQLRSYHGTYGNRDIHYEDDTLYYQYKGRSKRRMLAISDEYFIVEGCDFIRVRIIAENGTVRGIREIFDDGTVTTLARE